MNRSIHSEFSLLYIHFFIAFSMANSSSNTAMCCLLLFHSIFVLYCFTMQTCVTASVWRYGSCQHTILYRTYSAFQPKVAMHAWINRLLNQQNSKATMLHAYMHAVATVESLLSAYSILSLPSGSKYLIVMRCIPGLKASHSA